MKACRYCKSPARGNPCWYFLDRPEQATSGADPPCAFDAEDEADAYAYQERRGRRRKLSRRRWTIFFVVVILASAAAVLLFR